MTVCPKCFFTFQRIAAFCPHCGYDIALNSGPKLTSTRAFLALCIILIVFTVLMNVIGAFVPDLY